VVELLSPPEVDDVARATAAREDAPRRGAAPGDGLLWAARTAAVGVNVAGLAVATVGRVLRLPRAPIAVEAAVSLAGHQPWLRGTIEDRIGASATDTVLSVASTAAHTLTLSPAKLSVELATQVFKTAERGAAERARARHGVAAPAAGPTTPRRAPAGPVHRHAARAALAQAAGTGLIGAATGSLAMASTAAVTTAPKALRTTGEAFAATLSRELANRDAAVPLRPTSLRRLGEVDTVLVDPRVLCGMKRRVVRVRGGADADLATAWTRAQELLDDPGLAPGWHPVAGMAAIEALVLPAQHRLASAVVTEARGSGVRLVTADVDLLGELRPGFDEVRPVADGAVDAALTGARAQLQQAGRTVAVLAPAGAPVLSGADVALGVAATTGAPAPAGTDLLLFDLVGAWQVLHALPAAREADRNGIAISTGASALGGLLLVPGVRAWRGPGPVTVGAAAGLLSGFLLARRAARAPVPRPAPAYQWHAMSAPQVREVLAAAGPTAAPSALSPEPTGPHGIWQFFRAVRAELTDPMTPVLALCSAATAMLGSPIDATIVGTALVGNAMIAAGQRLRAENRLNVLLAQQTPPARALAAGGEATRAYREVPAERLQPGDVIEVRSNEVVPADARVIEQSDVEVDESSLTGESLSVGKQVEATPGAELAERYCMLYAGTTVVAGTAVAIVTAVDADTQMRRATELASGDLPEVGLQRQLSELVSRAFPASFGGGALVGALGLLRGGGVRQALGNAIAVAVAAIPEGMPLMATLAQFASARRLSSTGALVRTPRAIEALGRLDVVCFDKTGTLSQNRLQVTGVHPVPGASRDEVVHGAAQAAPAPDGAPPAHATDQAIIEAAAAAGCPAPARQPDVQLPFRSGRAFSARLSGGQLSVKGAPEVVLAACTGVGDDAEGTVAELATAGLRVIAVASRQLNDQQVQAIRENPDRISQWCGTGLVLTGFLALADTARPEAPQLLAGLAERGVPIRLITGDHPVTAAAIAAELGMTVDTDRVITGAEWNTLSRSQQEHAVGERVIFARMSPENKVQIVQTLTRSGQVCAMVGDGANDAAAIRAATVGIGVVTRGSDAAHTTADIVLTDGRIEALMEAIDEGRRLWRGVQAAVAGLLGGNAGEVIFTIIGSIVTGNTPLNPRQLLLMNMLTDALPATAVAVSAPAGSVQSGTRGLDEGALWRAVAVRGAITGAAGTAAWAMARLTGRPQRAATVALIALVCVEFGQMLVDSHAPLVVATAAGSFAVFVAMVNTPGVSQLLGCTPIGPLGWAQALGAAGTATAALAVLKQKGRHGLAVA
jgi:magnesium-transporting ATPase (P-type)